MKTKLEAMVDFLAGRRGEDAEGVRANLADPDSDDSQFLAASLVLSRDVFAPHVFRGLGLPLTGLGQVPEVTLPPSPPTVGQVLLQWLPWATTALVTAAVAWLLLAGPGHKCRPEHPDDLLAVATPFPTLPTAAQPPGPAAGGIPAPAEASPCSDLVRDFEGELQQAQAENRRLREELDQLHSLSAALIAARSEVADLKARLKGEGVKVGDLEQGLADATKKIDDLENEKGRSASLQKKLDRAEEKIKTLEAMLATANQNEMRLKTELAAAAQTIQALAMQTNKRPTDMPLKKPDK